MCGGSLRRPANPRDERDLCLLHDARLAHRRSLGHVHRLDHPRLLPWRRRPSGEVQGWPRPSGGPDKQGQGVVDVGVVVVAAVVTVAVAVAAMSRMRTCHRRHRVRLPGHLSRGLLFVRRGRFVAGPWAWLPVQLSRGRRVPPRRDVCVCVPVAVCVYRASPQSGLPLNWRKVRDERSMRDYYVNTKTGERTWTKPTMPADADLRRRPKSVASAARLAKEKAQADAAAAKAAAQKRKRAAKALDAGFMMASLARSGALDSPRSRAKADRLAKDMVDREQGGGGGLFGMSSLFGSKKQGRKGGSRFVWCCFPPSRPEYPGPSPHTRLLA